MAKIKMRSTSLSGDPNGTNLKFHFFPYAEGLVLRNNEQDVDFVTDGKSLYVCYIDGYQTHGSIQENGAGLLKIVSQGEPGKEGKPGQDGAAGAVPTIGAQFIDGAGEKKLALTVNGRTAAMTDDLTPPSWKPVVDGNILSWELTDDRYAPDSIDLMKLRPINERPILLRTNSDNTKRSDEVSGPANFIQWKYEGDEYWTNLISISELMNLALAGVSFWEATDGKWHFGHREVVRANYISDKNGRQIISNVRLGDVLFDAGEVPFPDNRLDIELINQRLDALEADIVKSVSINGGNPNEPDLNGNVDLDLSAYAKKSEIPDTVDAYTQAQSDARYQPKGNYVKGIKVNGGTTKYPDSNTGIVNLDVQTGYGTDTSDCVKSVTINGTTKTPVNGNVSFTISVGEPSLFDVRFDTSSHKLQKTVDGQTWTDLVDLDDFGGTVSEVTEADVKHIIGQILEGVLDSAIPEYVRTSGHNYFVRINEINSLLSNYYTKNEINALLAGGGDPEEITIVSYRTFTIYKWYPIDSNPSTPTLPTSASWDGTSNGLTLVGNTINWTNNPGNRPNDSARLWLATITLQSDGTSSSDWSGPIDLTAYPGKDGNGIEFIYTLCANETEFNALTTPAAQYQDDRDDDYPSGWTDQPQSIWRYTAADEIVTHHTFTGNEEVLFRIEAASIRTSTNGHWSTYCKPFIWSMWGEDGLDGDGVEYIFFLTDGTNGVVTESNGEYSLNQNNWPDNSWAYEYQAPNSGWTDDPSGVSASVPYEFVSKRKYHMDSETRQGAWSNWSEPALWSIYKEGPQGPGGGPGPAGPKGDEYEKVYGLAGNSLPITKTIDATITDANNKTVEDDGYLPNFVFDGTSVAATATPQGVSSINRYEYESIRRKHNGVWGAFSAPALHSNFVEAGLTQEQLENIKNDVETAIGEDLNAAIARLDTAEDRLDAIDGVGSTFFQDNESALVSVLTQYKDANQTSFADLILDGSQAEITLQTAAQTAEGLSNVQTDMNAIKGIIGNYADYEDNQGNVSTVKSLLDSKASSAEISATYATKQSVTDARTEWNAANESLQSSVAKATYVWVKYDAEDNVIDVQPFNGEQSKQGYVKKLSAEAMTAIRQSANEVDIIANWGNDTWAQIIAKAEEETGSSIILSADNINLSGTTNATTAVIGNATITGAEITNGTITNATIDNCTINSTIVSDDYNGTTKTGFLIDPENGDFAFYADNAKFDSDNGLQFNGTQTISWDDIDGRPESLEDLDPDNTLSTFITRDSLTTNKITANEIDASDLEVAAANITGKLTASQIDATNLHVDSANIDGEITATVAKFDYLMVDGKPISADNSLDIAFGDSSTATTARYTLYFLY